MGIDRPEQTFTIVRHDNAFATEKSVGGKDVMDWILSDKVRDIPIQGDNPFTVCFIHVDSQGRQQNLGKSIEGVVFYRGDPRLSLKYPLRWDENMGSIGT